MKVEQNKKFVIKVFHLPHLVCSHSTRPFRLSSASVSSGGIAEFVSLTFNFVLVS